jgi:hypothetical protein
LIATSRHVQLLQFTLIILNNLRRWPPFSFNRSVNNYFDFFCRIHLSFPDHEIILSALNYELINWYLNKYAISHSFGRPHLDYFCRCILAHFMANNLLIFDAASYFLLSTHKSIRKCAFIPQFFSMTYVSAHTYRWM